MEDGVAIGHVVFCRNGVVSPEDGAVGDNAPNEGIQKGMHRVTRPMGTIVVGNGVLSTRRVSLQGVHTVQLYIAFQNLLRKK